MTESDLRRTAKVVLVLTTVLFGLALIPAGMIAPMSVMAFDGGVSVTGVLFVLLVLGFPLAILASIPASWICYRRGVYRGAIGVSLLPLVNVGGVAVMFATLD